MPPREDLLAEALGRPWYHTIELTPTAATDGAVDLRRLAARVLPGRLDGLRALDVGTFDGFWAFALERRGADVVATDVDRAPDETQWPPLHRATSARGEGERFGLAAELLRSRVRRVTCPVHELGPSVVGGPVDYAVMGDLLLHVRDPVGALERVRSTLRPGGRLLSLEQVSVPLSLLAPHRAAGRFAARSDRMSWWEPNLRALRDYLRVAGFRRARLLRVYRLEAHPPQDRWHAAVEAVA